MIKKGSDEDKWGIFVRVEIVGVGGIGGEIGKGDGGGHENRGGVGKKKKVLEKEEQVLEYEGRKFKKKKRILAI